MLDQINLNKEISKEDFKKQMKEMEPRIALAERRCKALGIPVIILFEGWGASGKGTLINRLIQPLDPRGFRVFTIQEPTEDEAMRPFMWRFWTRTPASGRIHIFDQSWYERALFEDKKDAIAEITNFEEQLATGGTLIIKFFLHISKEEQARRFKKLESLDATQWRVNDRDREQNKDYDSWVQRYDKLLIETDKAYAPWTVVESTDREYAAAKILSTAALAMEAAADKKEAANAAKAAAKAAKAADKSPEAQKAKEEKNDFRNGVLAGVDLTQKLSRKEYKEKLETLQKRMKYLHNEMYQHRIPVVLAFEGWDAGGKGGAIKRITEAIDPRGYEVCPTAAPNDIEKAHHYLWRFWEKVPKFGHLAIFDRTWYGRVMVERIEGFCTEQEWKRAYAEMNQMESCWTNDGYVVLKFWMQIDKDEQERRFTERQNTPEKQWKITDEDWRNRAKWDQYEEAVDEMIVKTSTEKAPWIIVAGNDKYTARIQVLEAVVNAIEARMNEVKGRKSGGNGKTADGRKNVKEEKAGKEQKKEKAEKEQKKEKAEKEQKKEKEKKDPQEKKDAKDAAAVGTAEKKADKEKKAEKKTDKAKKADQAKKKDKAEADQTKKKDKIKKTDKVKKTDKAKKQIK
jgi:polyphosphate:AMP phosphotransferase